MNTPRKTTCKYPDLCHYEVTLTIGQWDFDAEDPLEQAIQQIYAEFESFYCEEE